VGQKLHRLKEAPQVRVFTATSTDQEVEEGTDTDDYPDDLEDVGNLNESLDRIDIVINLPHDVLDYYRWLLDILCSGICNGLRVTDRDSNLVIVNRR